MFVKYVQVQNLHVLSNAYKKTYNKGGFSYTYKRTGVSKDVFKGKGFEKPPKGKPLLSGKSMS